MYKQIFLDAPLIGEQEKEYLARAIDQGYVSTAGPFVPEFEQKFARYLNAGKAVSTQSGTAAIHVSLCELGIGPGDEVIVPALTFVASVNPVKYAGATPVFADVEPDTWDISPAEIKKCITSRTKAIIPVHLYGNPCRMEEINAIAAEHGLYVIEDATESLGATVSGRYTGTLGDFGCFSFNGNKLITTGGGGAVTGRNAGSLDHIKFLVNQARDESRGYYHPEIGFNYRMTNLEAAMGLAQMDRLGGFLEKKRSFSRMYREQLKGLGAFQQEAEGAASAFWLTAMVLNEGVRPEALQKGLSERGIQTRRIFMPVPEFPPYAKYSSGPFPNSYAIYERGLCLPSSPRNTEEDIYSVCDAIKGLLSR